MKALKISLIPCLFFLAGVGQVFAQAQTFDQWVDSRIDKIVMDFNSKSPLKQKESESSTPSSTSLVDQSAASDFVALALNMLPFSGDPENPDNDTATTMTISAYSLIAWGSGKEITDPELYKKYTTWRRLYLTLGSAESKLAVDNSNKLATVVGLKWLIINGQDIYSKTGMMEIDKVHAAVNAAAGAGAQLKPEIQRIIFQSRGGGDEARFKAFISENFSEATFPALAASLSTDTKDQIDRAIMGRLPAFANLSAAIQQAFNKVQRGRQMALSVTSNLRPENGNDDYRAQFIYSHGFNDRITWTINASADYKNLRTGEDMKTGRFATEFLGTLNNPSASWGRAPITLAFSGEGKWAKNAKPSLTGQVKLTIPITPGVDLPVVYRYANRTALAEDDNAEVRLGLTVDVARLAKIFDK
jgi:hypothetical protein